MRPFSNDYTKRRRALSRVNVLALISLSQRNFQWLLWWLYAAHGLLSHVVQRRRKSASGGGAADVNTTTRRVY